LDESLRDSLRDYFKNNTCELSDTGRDWDFVQENASRLFPFYFYIANISLSCTCCQYFCRFCG